MNKKYYVYLYLDQRKPGQFVYGQYEFEYLPFYIGKGKNGRCKEHLYEAYSERDKRDDYISYKCNKIRKIKRVTGRDPIIVKIKENMKESDAFQLEIELISLIGRIDLKNGPLVNLTDGGEGVSGISEETREKIREASKGNKNCLGRECSQETRDKKSAAMTGYKFSEERNKKISKALKGKPKSKRHRNNIKKSHIGMKGKHPSEETRKKQSEAQKGKKSHMYGKHLSQETREKLRKVRSKPVFANFLKFSSLNEAGNFLGVSPTTIYDRIKAGKPGYRYLNA